MIDYSDPRNQISPFGCVVIALGLATLAFGAAYLLWLVVT